MRSINKLSNSHVSCAGKLFTCCVASYRTVSIINKESIYFPVVIKLSYITILSFVTVRSISSPQRDIIYADPMSVHTSPIAFTRLIAQTKPVVVTNATNCSTCDGSSNNHQYKRQNLVDCKEFFAVTTFFQLFFYKMTLFCETVASIFPG